MACRAEMAIVVWSSARAAVVALGLLAGASAAAAQTLDVQAATTAAEAAVRDAFGGDVEVMISEPVLQAAAGSTGVVKAVPEPGSRSAGRVRFVLYADGDGPATRIGRLTAIVRVRAPHVRARGPIEVRSALVAEALAAIRDDIGRQPFQPLPSLDELVGGTTRKPLADNDVLTRSALVTRPLVASGDEVVTVARVGALEVRGRAIAAQSGGLGDKVIVVNPDSRKRLHARVVADALVEVIHGS